jgi:hemerythrin-like domain-containing protein
LLRDPALVPLSHQHHNGLALCVLAERALREDSSEENVRRWAAKAVDRYEIELSNHFELEEQLLFPAHPGDLAARLAAEHRELERHIGELRGAPSRATLDAFLALLRAHIRTEENEYFESAQRAIGPGDLHRIGEEIARRAVRVCL